MSNPRVEPPGKAPYQSIGSPHITQLVPSASTFIFGIPIRPSDQQVSKNVPRSSPKPSDTLLLPSQTVAEESALVPASTPSSSSNPISMSTLPAPPPPVLPACTLPVANQEVSITEDATPVIAQRTTGLLAQETSHIVQPVPSSHGLSSAPINAGPTSPATTAQIRSTGEPLPGPNINPHSKSLSRFCELRAPRPLDNLLL